MTSKGVVCKRGTLSRRGLGILLMSSALCCASAVCVAAAGIHVWTSHGPAGGLVTSVAIDAVVPPTLYAGTDGAGVSKSTDGGTTWQSSNTGLPDSTVFVVVIHPLMPDLLYAGTAVGVFKTTDSGGSWEESFLTLDGARVLALDPS